MFNMIASKVDSVRSEGGVAVLVGLQKKLGYLVQITCIIAGGRFVLQPRQTKSLHNNRVPRVDAIF